MQITTTAEALFIEVEPGVKIFINDTKYGAKGTFIFLHGWPMSSKMFEYQFDFLSRQEYRCIGVDMRGFGDSDKPESAYSYDLFANDLKVIFEKLNLKDIILVGYSMGAAVALRYATKDQEKRIKKLILAGAAAPSFVRRKDFNSGVEPFVIELMIKNCIANRANMLTKFGESCFALKVRPEFSHYLHSIAMSASPHATIECLKVLRDSDLREDMAHVSVPTLIMHGKRDKIAPVTLAKVLQSGIKDSQLIVFENCGHGIFYDDHKKFNQSLIEFAVA